jgi:hypothetical protein
VVHDLSEALPDIVGVASLLETMLLDIGVNATHSDVFDLLGGLPVLEPVLNLVFHRIV